MIAKTLAAAAVVALPLIGGFQEGGSKLVRVEQSLAAASTATAPLAADAGALASDANSLAANTQDSKKPGKFVVEYVRTEHSNAYDVQGPIGSLLENLNIASTWLGDTDAQKLSTVTVRAIGEHSIMVATPQEWFAPILDQIKRIDAELADTSGAEIQTFQYQIRHVSQNAVERALEPFRSTIQNASPRGSRGPVYTAASVTIVRDTGTVIVRDTEARIAEVQRVLERIDRPEAQVSLRYYLIRGYTTEQSAEDEGWQLSDLYTDHFLDPNMYVEDFLPSLRSLIPMVGVRLESFGVLQGDALAEKSFSDGVGNARFDLRMYPTAFDEQTGTLSVDQIDFQCVGFGASESSQQGFKTSAKLTPGRFTILGGVGAEPLFLVLHMSRM
ncbi:MAG: secretin N-terminal domain-containing protein [Planctomycetota bacterium]